MADCTPTYFLDIRPHSDFISGHNNLKKPWIFTWTKNVPTGYGLRMDFTMEPSPVESAGGLRKFSGILGGAGGDSGDSVGRGGVETNQKRSEPNLRTSERSARTSEREEEAPAPMKKRKPTECVDAT